MLKTRILKQNIVKISIYIKRKSSCKCPIYNGTFKTVDKEN